MYILKHLPEDFIVKEVPDIGLDENGEYSYFWLKKKDYNTTTALEHIANKVHIPLKHISAAGNKDKKAITEQLISIKNINKERVERLEMKDLSLSFYGKGNRPISRGLLKGNEFIITVRNLNNIPKAKESFINYFGPQRFGTINVDVGRALLKQEWKKACELLNLPGKNPVNELQKQNKSVLKLYVHAFQSFLWNKTVEHLIKTEKERIPLIGFSTETDDQEVQEIIDQLLKEEDLTQRSFIIRQLPELSVEGGERNVNTKASNLKIEEADDEFFPGKKKAIFSFFLEKGCYATVFIDQALQAYHA